MGAAGVGPGSREMSAVSPSATAITKHMPSVFTIVAYERFGDPTPPAFACCPTSMYGKLSFKLV